MKKLIAFIMTSLSIVSSSVFAQDIVLQKNTVTPDNLKEEIFSINGISAREDIGGVEVKQGEWRGSERLLNFENYNEKAVTVLYLVNNQYTGSIVLKAGESKETGTSYYKPNDVKIIVRPMGGIASSNTNNAASQLKTVAGYLEYSDEFKDKWMTLLEANDLLIKLNATNYMEHNNWRFPTDVEVKLLNMSSIFSKTTPYPDERGILIPVRNKQ